MSKFLSLLSGNWLYLVVLAVGFGFGSLSGYKVKDFLDRPTIAEAKQNTAEAQSALKQAEARFAQSIAESERNRADTNLKALQEKDELAVKADKLRTQLSKEVSEREKQTKQRLEALHNVPQTDTSPLGPGARAFYDSLRKQQQANDRNNPTPVSGPNR